MRKRICPIMSSSTGIRYCTKLCMFDRGYEDGTYDDDDCACAFGVFMKDVAEISDLLTDLYTLMDRRSLE